MAMCSATTKPWLLGLQTSTSKRGSPDKEVWSPSIKQQNRMAPTTPLQSTKRNFQRMSQEEMVV